MPLPGLNSFSFDGDQPAGVTFRVEQHTLQRLLAFAGYSFDDVLRNPIAFRELEHYYKLHRAIERQFEVDELEEQWNPLGYRPE